MCKNIDLVLLSLLLATGAIAQPLAETVAPTPIIQPQPDGVIYLNADAAALVKWNGKLASLENVAMRRAGGAIVKWSADSERPTWRVNFAAGFYRVVVNRRTPTGENFTAALYLFTKVAGQRPRMISRQIEVGDGAFELGEIEADAGEKIVELRPQNWVSPFAMGQLLDVRFVPLGAMRATQNVANIAWRKTGVDALPNLAPLAEKERVLLGELGALNQETRRRDFAVFTDLKQFFEHDKSAARLAAVEKELRALRAQLFAARVANIKANGALLDKLSADEKVRLDEHLRAAEFARVAETKTYTPTVFAPQIAPRGTLFSTGNFDELPAQPINEKLPQVNLPVTPPPDAAARRAQFLARNSEANLAALCRDFQKVLVPGTPGLEEFEKLANAGKHRAALEAYRAYFFAKLKNPEAHGAVTQNILFELTRDRGRGELLLRPTPFVIEKNMNGAAVAQIGNEVVTCEVGMPGAASWVPRGIEVPPAALLDGRVKRDEFWKTPAGKDAARALEFYRYLHCLPGDRAEYYAGGLFPALVWSYAQGGDKNHLARWCEYLDDWTANARRDQNEFAIPTRNATELETQFVRCTYNLLRLVFDERPDLARDFDAATLARLQMKLVTDYAPYLIRARRAEMANWGIMGLCHLQHLGRFMSEFSAMDYFNREAWRLWNANLIQHRTPDGENIEAWDEGHNGITFEYSTQSVPFARLPGVDELDLLRFWDHVKTDARSKLIHISPAGNYWPTWDNQRMASRHTIRSRYRNDPANRNPYDLVEHEPEFAARLETLQNHGTPPSGKLPAQFSDFSPYAGMAYLRESWKPDADYFLMQNFRTRSQSQDDCSRTMYSLSNNDRILVEAHGLLVDLKPDNRYLGKTPAGGKTDYSAQADRNVVGDRFHTSPRFEFAEATQNAPYAQHRRGYQDDYGIYRHVTHAGDPNPITDVTAKRQVFGVRGENIWLVCDRIESRGNAAREYTQFFTLPLRIAENGYAERAKLIAASGVPPIETDAATRRARTANPGFENVTLHFFANAPLQFANTLNARREHETAKTSLLEGALAALKAGKTPDEVGKKFLRQPVSVRWNGRGNQLLVTALNSRPASFNLVNRFAGEAKLVEEIKGEGGALGCHIVTKNGSEIWLQSGPQAQNKLVCGPLSARAETLLVIKKNNVISGVVLGAASLEINGKIAATPAADCEFEIANGVFRVVERIHRPLDTVQILPAQTCFTDELEVSFSPPPTDAELRYTLDGSEPTLQSALYAAPFVIEKSTMVKVRPFRKGLKTTPWNFGGTQSGVTANAIFRKRAPLPAVNIANAAPGLKYDYFEGDWPTLMSYAGTPGVLETTKRGTASDLLIWEDLYRKSETVGPFAMRYDGYVVVPATGVYTFAAPEHLFTPTQDAGYDLRVWIDGEEWFPNPQLHAEHLWSVPLQAGAHRLRVVYVDYRTRPFRSEYWMAWQAEQMGQAVPVLEVSGPNFPRGPVPAAWLRSALYP